MPNSQRFLQPCHEGIQQEWSWSCTFAAAFSYFQLSNPTNPKGTLKITAMLYIELLLQTSPRAQL